MKKNLLLVIVLLVLSFYSQAQFGSLSFSVGIPQNEFQENTDATGFGGDLTIGMPLQKGIPIFLGLDLNYMAYGFNSRREDLRADIVNPITGENIEVLNIPLRMTTTNNLFGGHAFIRAQAPFALVKPYAEFLGGFRMISTVTKITDESEDRILTQDDENNILARERIVGDWVLSYGYGGGFMIKVAPTFHIDIRANFFRGNRAQYLDAEDTQDWRIQYSNTDPIGSGDIAENLFQETLTFKESRTDILVIKIGAALQF